MKHRKMKSKAASRIADRITELVDRADGPVTLARIEREVPGFAAKGQRSWTYETEGDNGEDGSLIWDGMSKAGRDALRSVRVARRVAIQMGSRLNYVVDG